jgi:hypothetical protein
MGSFTCQLAMLEPLLGAVHGNEDTGVRMSANMKALFTIAFDGDREAFVAAMLADVPALTARCGATRAALDVIVGPDDLAVVRPSIPSGPRVRSSRCGIRPRSPMWASTPQRRNFRNSAVTNAGSPAPSVRAATVARKSVRWARTTP